MSPRDCGDQLPPPALIEREGEADNSQEKTFSSRLLIYLHSFL